MEGLLYEGNVSLNNNKFNILLTIDEEHLLFQKQKGLFKKKYVTEKEILIKNINVSKDKKGINLNKNSFTVLTSSEDYTFTCSSEEEAKKIYAVLDKLVFVPEDEKKKKFKKIAKGAFKVAVAVISSGAAVDIAKGIAKKDMKLIAKAAEKTINKF